MNRRTIFIVAAVLVLLCICAVGVVVVIILAGSVEEPANVDISINAPAAVPLNEPFAVDVTIRNTAPSSQVLDSIDITDRYLAGIEVQQAEPAFSDSFAVPVVNYQSYTFQEEILSNSTMVVTFVMVGTTAGTYSGEFDVCINDGSSCLAVPVETAVGEMSGR